MEFEAQLRTREGDAVTTVLMYIDGRVPDAVTVGSRVFVLADPLDRRAARCYSGRCAEYHEALVWDAHSRQVVPNVVV